MYSLSPSECFCKYARPSSGFTEAQFQKPPLQDLADIFFVEMTMMPIVPMKETIMFCFNKPQIGFWMLGKRGEPSLHLRVWIFCLMLKIFLKQPWTWMTLLTWTSYWVFSKLWQLICFPQLLVSCKNSWKMEWMILLPKMKISFSPRELCHWFSSKWQCWTDLWNMLKTNLRVCRNFFNHFLTFKNENSEQII